MTDDGDRNAREELVALVSIVSHDLRNPLHAVAIAAEELANANLTADERRRYAAAVSRGIARANALIDRLLDVSKIEAGALDLACAPVRASSLLQRAANDHALAADAAHVSLLVEAADDLPPLVADPARVQQALDNLISNALAHTPSGGRIALRARASGGATIALEVSDTGRGIAPDDLPHVFDRFWRARERSGTGTGLGLAIVKGVAQAHGGTVEVESELGAGTTVRVLLPVHR